MRPTRPAHLGRRASVHFFTVRDVAELLHLHPDTVREQLRAGKIPFVRVGRMYKIPVTWLGFEPPEDDYRPFQGRSEQLALFEMAPVKRRWRNRIH